MADDNLIKSAADVAKAVVEAVPIYQDAIQPAAKELGKALQTVAKTVHVALAPLSALVWGYERIAQYLNRRVPELLEGVPPERIVTPNPGVAGPALESLRFAANDPDLREMYARLLATAMDQETAANAHPAFAETIKQLHSDEAKILKRLSDARYQPQPVVTLFVEAVPPRFPHGDLVLRRHVSLLPEQAVCAAPALAASYLDNLSRLGLIQIHKTALASSERYVELENTPTVVEHLNRSRPELESVGLKSKLARGHLRFTDFGQQFVVACILNERERKVTESLNQGEDH